MLQGWVSTYTAMELEGVVWLVFQDARYAAGREHDWVKLIGQRFQVERRIDAPAVTGYITHQLRMPDVLALPLLRVLCTVDRLLVRLKILRNTGVILYARKSVTTM